jgi:hypothetical protein
VDISNAVNIALALKSEDMKGILSTWLFIYPTFQSISTISAFLKNPPQHLGNKDLAASIRRKYPNGIAPPR